MKKLALLLFVVLGACSPKPVATLITQPNRVLYASSDLDQVSSTDSIAKIKPGGHWLARNMKLTLRNGEQKTIAKKDIWGYSDDKGIVWRRFGTMYYKVLQVNDVVEYVVVEPRQIGRTIVQEPVRKYSKTLDSKIFGSRNRALRMGNEEN